MILLAGAAAVPSATATAPAPPACRAGQLRASLDARDGDFNGMSHSGTLLVLRNRGAACRIAALPEIAFRDARGRMLPIARAVPPGLHPGPVMVPLIVAAAGIVSTPLRWVAGDVYDRSRCYRPARLRVTIGGGALAVAFQGRICGEASAPARFEQPPLRPGTATDGG